MSSKSLKRQRFIAFVFINTIQYPRTLSNNIYHSNKRESPKFFSFGYNTWPASVHSVDNTHVLVVTVEMIWLLFLNIFFATLFQNRTNLLGSQDSEEAQLTQTSLRRLQDVFKRSRRPTTKPDVVRTSGKTRLICDVLKTSYLRRLKNVQLRRLEDVLFTSF